MPVRLSKGTREKVAMLVAHYAQVPATRQQLHPGVTHHAKALREKTTQQLITKYKYLLSVQAASMDFMAGGREFHKERDVPVLTKQEEEFLTALTAVGTAAYEKLVRSAKIGPLF